jgi:hypothetical protein
VAAAGSCTPQRSPRHEPDTRKLLKLYARPTFGEPTRTRLYFIRNLLPFGGIEGRFRLDGDDFLVLVCQRDAIGFPRQRDIKLVRVAFAAVELASPSIRLLRSSLNS